MQIWLKTVTRAWAAVAALLASPDVVNVWRVGANRAWHGLVPGDLVLFRPEGCRRNVVGYGRFIMTTIHPLMEAWHLFTFANGAWTVEDFRAQAEARCRQSGWHDPVLANTLMASPVFFPPLNPFILPDPFPTASTAAPLCPALSRRGRILVRSLRHHAGRSLVFGEGLQARLLGARTYRVPSTVVRVDSQVLRSVVSELYGHRCAISGARVTVALDAAHPWPLKYGGPDELGNCVLLAADLHRLWDHGYIGVDEAHRIMISDAIRAFEPNPAILRYAGQPLRCRTAGQPYPDESNLRWHRNTRFKWPMYTPPKQRGGPSKRRST